MNDTNKAMHVIDNSGLDALRECNMEPRDPGPGEVQVRVHASSLNYHDYLVVAGVLPTEKPRIPMSDAAGDVLAVGEGVSTLAVGDRVISHFFQHWVDGAPSMERLLEVPGDHADGFACQIVTRPAGAFSLAPRHMDYAEAATLPCAALTAWRALVEEARLRPGDWVMVQGSGGVSVFALQMAKAMGCRVIATSSSDDKLQRLAELGADELINYREHPHWGRIAVERSGGGVALVLEVGGPGTVTQSVRALRFGGEISMIGVLTGIAGDVPLAEFFQRNARMSGITVGSHAQQRAMVQALEAWELRPVIDSRFPLERLADAFRHQESQQHFGKIVVDI
jgi:NADPH:quinone reductase-like Zn-dependent oxidoreductase